MTGRYEPQETLILGHLLRPRDVFVDVGANWGYFTLLGAHLVGPHGRVLGVEADPHACRALERNIARNRLQRVDIVHAAASDARGRLSFEPYDRARAPQDLCINAAVRRRP